MDSPAQRLLALFEGLRLVGTETARTQLIKDLRTKRDRPQILSFINAHAVNLAWKSEDFSKSLLNSDILVRDGKGMELGLKALGRSAGLNLNGTDFIPLLFSYWGKGLIALLGTRDPALSKASQTIEAHYPLRVVCQKDGFAPTEDYAESLKGLRPDIILLAMGMPKQESVAEHLRASLPYPCLIINGGAILDYLSGQVPRAPLWMRRIGMEWFYRLLVEPRRLAKRYLIGNGLFLWRVGVLTFHKALKASVPADSNRG